MGSHHRATKSASSIPPDKSDIVSTSGISVKSVGSKGSKASRESGEEDGYTPFTQSRQYDWDRSLNDDTFSQLS